MKFSAGHCTTVLLSLYTAQKIVVIHSNCNYFLPPILLVKVQIQTDSNWHVFGSHPQDFVLISFSLLILMRIMRAISPLILRILRKIRNVSWTNFTLGNKYMYS